MYNRWFAAILIVGVLVGSPFLPGLSAAEEGDTHSDGEEHDEDVIRLTPERIRVAGIEIAPVVEIEFDRKIKATGEVVLNADHTAHVGPRIPGRIAKIYGFLGDQVSPGQPLLVLDSVELGQAGAEFRKARARLDLAKRNYQREKRVYDAKISSEREMLEAQTAYEEAQIESEAAEEELHILGMPQKEIDQIQAAHKAKGATLLPLPAPFAGVIVQKHATLGEVVDPSTTLYTVSDLSTVWVEAHIYEKDLRIILKGSSATVTVDAYPGEVFEGVMTYISDLLDGATRTVKARVEVSNHDRKLRAGMFADVSVPSGDRIHTIAVPETSVLNDGKERIVYVTEDGETFREREIQIGDRYNGYVAVLSGLELGEKIVVKGSFFIRSEAAKEGFGAGHAH